MEQTLMLPPQLPAPSWKMNIFFLAAEPRCVVLAEESAASSQGGVPSSLLGHLFTSCGTFVLLDLSTTKVTDRMMDPITAACLIIPP